jgi:hypothetical protein
MAKRQRSRFKRDEQGVALIDLVIERVRADRRCIAERNLDGRVLAN